MHRLRDSAASSPRERTVGWPVAALATIGVVLVALGVTRLRSDESADGAPFQPDDRSTTTVSARAATGDQVGAPLPSETYTTEGRRYRIGQAGDHVLVEDWDCDGTPTPAVLRPDTGEVFVFPRWIDAGELAVAPVMQVSGAQHLVADISAGGCSTLAVQTEAGEVVPIVEGRS
jgi:hypothetical protein